MGTYNDPQYGVVERLWIGRTVKHGGNSSAGVTFNETEGFKVTRTYLKGPVRLLSFGVLTLATLGKGEQLFRLSKGTTLLDRCVASTTSAPYTIASVALDDAIDSGTYLTIFGSTNVCSTGTVAFFIDYRRSYGSGWEPAY